MIDLIPAARRTGALVAGISDEQLSAPTPCPRYSLAALLEHVDGLAQAFTKRRHQEHPRGRQPERARRR